MVCGTKLWRPGQLGRGGCRFRRHTRAFPFPFQPRDTHKSQLKAAPIYVCENEVFWGELAPSDHLVHLYETKDAFLRLLEDFVADGLQGGEAVIVIATQAHRVALNERLEDRGLDLASFRNNSQYLDLSA